MSTYIVEIIAEGSHCELWVAHTEFIEAKNIEEARSAALTINEAMSVCAGYIVIYVPIEEPHRINGWRREICRYRLQ